MAINKNHEFEELDGIKCAIVEKNVPGDRVAFLKDILQFNNYTVVVAPSPTPKAAAAPKPVATVTAENDKAATPAEPETPVAPPPPTTFTIGVTDVRFNATNAIFGRMLKTRDGKIVTLAYWQQKEAVANDEVPYFGRV
jgi:hypothetical protein